MTANYHARARMASVVDAIIARLALVATTKSINEVVRDFTNLVENMVIDAANGNIRRSAFVSRMNAAINNDGEAVYVEGLREGGVIGEELTDEDKQAIDNWIDSQAEHISSFADDAIAVGKLSGDERTAARDAMLGRVNMWVQAFESLGRLGYASAKSNAMGTWKLGETEKHCSTCSSLNGKRHRLSWFTSRGYLPRQPGSDSLECGGWHCDCEIVGDDGDRLL